MKQKITLLIILLLSFYSFNDAKAQDLIVTDENDSINCRITRAKKDFIYFTFNHKDEIRSTLLPVSNVKYYQFDFYQISEVPEEKVIGYRGNQQLIFAINSGYSYRTAKVAESVPSDFKNYMADLKRGFHIGGDVTYYFTETMGFGAKYFISKSSNSADNIYVEDAEGNKRYGKMSHDIAISFIGPTISTRLLNHDKSNAFYSNFSLGYMGYLNDIVIIDNFKMTGNTLGLVYDIGYEIGLSENLSLGFQISWIQATLHGFVRDDGKTKERIALEHGEYEGLNRFDFSIGLRFIR